MPLSRRLRASYQNGALLVPELTLPLPDTERALRRAKRAKSQYMLYDLRLCSIKKVSVGPREYSLKPLTVCHHQQSFRYRQIQSQWYGQMEKVQFSGIICQCTETRGPYPGNERPQK